MSVFVGRVLERFFQSKWEWKSQKRPVLLSICQHTHNQYFIFFSNFCEKKFHFMNVKFLILQCFKRAWPGISRSILDDHSRFVKTYFSAYPGYFFTGDGAYRDADGYYWMTGIDLLLQIWWEIEINIFYLIFINRTHRFYIIGRIEDLMNVSGHLLSTAEIESALVSDDDVVEAAVVAAPHDIKGNFPYAFVTLRMVLFVAIMSCTSLNK